MLCLCALGSNAWAQSVAPTDEVLWADNFGAEGGSNSTFTKNNSTIDTYQYTGRSGYLDNATNVTYTGDANVILATSTGTNVTSGHLWFNKGQQGVFTTSAINLYGAKKVNFSFSRSKGKTIVSYSFNGSDWTELWKDTKTAAQANQNADIETDGQTSIYIKIQEGEDTNNLRVDNLSLKVVTAGEGGDVPPVVKDVASIAVKDKPTKTTYYVGNSLDLTGGVITVTYTDNTSEEISMTASGVTTTGFDNTTAGEQTITVTYKDKTTTFNVTVNEAPAAAQRAIVALYNGKWYAATTTISNKALAPVEVKVANGKVYYDGTDDIVWNWDEATRVLSTGTDVLYAADGTTVSFKDGGTWTISEVDGIVNGKYPTRGLLYNSSDGFKNYALSNKGKANYSGASQLLPIGTMEEYNALLSATVTIGETGYATYCPADDVEVPAGVKVYSVANAAAENATFVELTEYTGTTLKQGEGVILNGNQGTYDFVKTTAATAAIEGNLLVGTTSATPLAANAAYVLVNENGSAKFSLCVDGTIAANKAYLPASAGNNAPTLALVLPDEPTAIQSANMTTKIADGARFNLAGQKVGTDYKGLVVKNGKKFIVK